ncbi:MAG: hypothetical protein HQL89_17125 [Magnetococcales bacterium]|nr:hypothetical protein [Magnetococcales bacterium]
MIKTIREGLACLLFHPFLELIRLAGHCWSCVTHSWQEGAYQGTAYMVKIWNEEP